MTPNAYFQLPDRSLIHLGHIISVLPFNGPAKPHIIICYGLHNTNNATIYTETNEHRDQIVADITAAMKEYGSQVKSLTSNL